MKNRSRHLAWLLGWAFVACGPQQTSDSADTTTESSSTSSATSVSQGSGGTSDTTSVVPTEASDNTGGETTAMDTEDPTERVPESGEMCVSDCMDDAETSVYCRFHDGMCGATEAGICVVLGGSHEVCEQFDELGGERPVCGCTGQTHASSCWASLKYESLSVTLDCPVPDGHVRCGWYFCRPDEDLCVQKTAMGLGVPYTSYRCEALPAACESEPGCGCLGAEDCPGTCSQGEGGLLICDQTEGG